MLNLLRFKKVADYSIAPELAPATDLSGEEAYGRYKRHAYPFLKKAGSTLIIWQMVEIVS